MAALRQASPFAGVLKPAERWAIYEAFEPARREAAGFGRNAEPLEAAAGKHDP